jgi:hypothetical protein
MDRGEAPTFLVTNNTIGGLKERLVGLPDSTPLSIAGLGTQWLVTPSTAGVIIVPAADPEPVAEESAAPKRRRGVTREE